MIKRLWTHAPLQLRHFRKLLVGKPGPRFGDKCVSTEKYLLPEHPPRRRLPNSIGYKFPVALHRRFAAIPQCVE
jgi:hypothetical protein